MVTRFLVLGCAFALTGWVSSAAGQNAHMDARPVEDPVPPAWLIDQVLNPEQDDAVKQLRREELAQAEQELKKLRYEYFKRTRNAEIRQIGLQKLRAYNDPALYPTLFELFQREGEDVMGGIMDMLVNTGTEEADAALAWAAVFEERDELREMASERLKTRMARSDEVSDRVQSVVALGLQDKEDDTLASAADLADELNLVQAIPSMINAQLGGTTAQLGSSARFRGTGAMAYILVANQVAFVSDLQPIVGESAVAFDPTVSVVSDGVVLSVSDAHVITYRMHVHNSLVNLTSRAFGRSTADLGFDQQAWENWYTNEFKPKLDAGELPLAAGEGDTPSNLSVIERASEIESSVRAVKGEAGRGASATGHGRTCRASGGRG